MTRPPLIAFLALALGLGLAIPSGQAAEIDQSSALAQQVQFYGPGYYRGPRYGYHDPRRYYRPRFNRRRLYGRGYYGRRYYGRGYYGRRF